MKWTLKKRKNTYEELPNSNAKQDFKGDSKEEPKKSLTSSKERRHRIIKLFWAC